MPRTNPCIHLAFTYILCWSLKRSVKRTWTGSAFSTNERAWSAMVMGPQSLVWSGPSHLGPMWTGPKLIKTLWWWAAPRSSVSESIGIRVCPFETTHMLQVHENSWSHIELLLRFKTPTNNLIDYIFLTSKVWLVFLSICLTIWIGCRRRSVDNL